MFKTFYNSNRFRYIHRLLDDSDLFEFVSNIELIPKTACFFSENLDVYIDTSDGVNDDLEMQEYCGRMLACMRLSRGKKFLYFKCALSSKWSANISKLAKDNNGIVVPFFKWSFNRSFYEISSATRKDLIHKVKNSSPKYHAGLFADFTKEYKYPYPSSQSPIVSCEDIAKFNLSDLFGPEAPKRKQYFKIRSRSSILKKLEEDKTFSLFCGPLKYKDYMKKSTECGVIINPPGIGEYTSRMMDQASIGNLIVLRENSYDHANSWKPFIPEVDFDHDSWREHLQAVLDNKSLWQEKIKYYFDELWSPTAVFDYFVRAIENRL